MQAESIMDMAERRLVRELVVVVLIKLAVIAALWWVFVREAKVDVDPAAMATRVAAPASSGQQQTPGETHGQ